MLPSQVFAKSVFHLKFYSVEEEVEQMRQEKEGGTIIWIMLNVINVQMQGKSLKLRAKMHKSLKINAFSYCDPLQKQNLLSNF